jgi:hypothetical protein
MRPSTARRGSSTPACFANDVESGIARLATDAPHARRLAPHDDRAQVEAVARRARASDAGRSTVASPPPYGRSRRLIFGTSADEAGRGHASMPRLMQKLAETMTHDTTSHAPVDTAQMPASYRRL